MEAQHATTREAAGSRLAADAGTTLPDLVDRDDVEELVQAFYETAFADELIGPIFVDIAQMDLPKHLPVMCDFWETVLFRAGLYHRNTLSVHAQLHALAPLREEHFARWLTLWTATVDRHFAGEKAERAKLQAERIAGAMCRRLTGAGRREFTRLPAAETMSSSGHARGSVRRGSK